MERHKVLNASLLKMLGAGMTILIDTYANTLFLSFYSKDWLPYLYFSLAIFGFLVMQFSQPLLKKNLSRFLTFSHIFFIAVFLICIYLTTFSFYWLPFFIAVFLLTASAIIGAVNFIAMMSFFSLREYKGIARWINFSTLVGYVGTGLLIALLLKFFPLSVLFYLIIGLLVVLLVMYSFCHFPAEKHEIKRHAPPPVKLLRDRYFILGFLAFLAMLTLYVFFDFSLKSQLSLNFTKNEMGQFLAIFNAVVTVLFLPLQLFAVPFVLRRFGVVGLLIIGPIILLPLALCMFIFPSLWAAILFAGLGTALRVGFFSTGHQMLSNVYPPSVRNVALYQTQSLGRLALGFSALLLLILTFIGDLRLIAAASIVCSLLLIYLCVKIGKYYFATLKTAINLHRFDTEYLETEKIDEEMTLKVASQALASPAEDIKLFGLSLFRKIKIKQVPTILLQTLGSEFVEVKKGALNLIKGSEDASVVAPLMRGLAREKNPELIWSYVETILNFSPDFLLSYASVAISNPESAIRAAAIYIFLAGGDMEEVARAQSHFLNMLDSENASDRYWASHILNSGTVKDPEKYIIQLLNDSNSTVARQALFAVRFCANESMIRLLAEKLASKEISHAVGNALLVIGAPVISVLSSYLQIVKNPRHLNLMLILFSKIPGDAAEEALLKLLQVKNPLILEMCSKSLAYRAKQFLLLPGTRNTIQKQIFNELALIKNLQALRLSYSDIEIENEIDSRIFYAKKRYLYLLAAYGEAATILQIIPTLLTEDRSSRAYDSSIELLELCVDNLELKQSISSAFEDRAKKKVDTSIVNKILDPWLMQVIAFKQKGEAMDELIEKILVLRKVPLFSALSAELLQSIAEIVQQEDMASGQNVFKEGEIADGMYIVVKGRVEILKNNQTINVCGPSAFFGELALLDDSPRFASAIAKEDTQLYFIEKTDFNRLTDEVPEILRALTQRIIGYLRQDEAA